ncbi:MAG: 4-hydroxythreonine-4-phosphate dehydrogenase PdxA [Xanthomonadales bacterium]|nr:4-hydroxythreonine-4-phosphate dehydrogenase PdxA [Xanthomonadales bacterium]
MSRRVPRLALTPGEPAGVGPELVVQLARRGCPAQLVAVADPELLLQASRSVRQPITLFRFDPARREPSKPGELCYVPVSMPAENEFGFIRHANASYVLATLQRAAAGCISGEFDALVTGPVNKAAINAAGIPFSGHTEFLAALSGVPRVVMMLTAGSLRVALATTHLPLRKVPDAITPKLIEDTAMILVRALKERYGIARPRVGVLGLNPHAGESGHMGREEIEVIEPTLEILREEGLDLQGPLPADTAFTPARLADLDAVLAMYHDQGLPVLKHAGFGHAVNVTLGLPFIRTSVDHGTALDLAGKGLADTGSMMAAAAEALRMLRGAGSA